VITIFAILGGLGFMGLVVAAVLYLFDTPARNERVRIEMQMQEAAWRIHQHTREAIGRMVDETNRQRQSRQS